MNTPKQQAELYRKAADTIEMCEKYCVEPKIKYFGNFENLKTCTFRYDLENYLFPLAVVEGKLVFKGDELYDKSGNKRKALYVKKSFCGIDSIYEEFGCFAHIDNCSWNPPKPKTVMVELTVEDAEIYSSKLERLETMKKTVFFDESDCRRYRTSVACRKALDELKDA